MNLTDEEKKTLKGERGPAAQKAMEILSALGEIYGAEDMVAVKSCQVAGVSYKNLGDAGLEFLEDLAAGGAKVAVPTTLNPAGIDVENWEDLGISKEFAEKQKRLLFAYERMGITLSCTCTPYLIGNVPSYGDHIAWSESSAVSYANSVLGARTNREGGPSALSAAICGKTPRYGLHLEENRRSDLAIVVKCELKDASDYGALGNMVGKIAGSRIPYFRLDKNKEVSQACLRALSASMAAAGSVALYHVEGVTPEAKGRNVLSEKTEKVEIDNLVEGYEALNSDGTDVDFVAVGCPHASLDELEKIASLLRGKTVASAMWITTSRKIKEAAEKRGIVKEIEKSGAKVVADTCMVVAPIEELGFKSMATNSGKAAFYAPSHCKLKTRYGSLEKCVDAAVSGRWR